MKTFTISFLSLVVVLLCFSPVPVYSGLSPLVRSGANRGPSLPIIDRILGIINAIAQPPFTQANTTQSTRACLTQFDATANPRLITATNRATQTAMTTLARERPHLRSLASTLQLGLGFSVLNNRGLGLSNYGKTVLASAQDIKHLAESLIRMVDEWEVLQAEVSAQRAAACLTTDDEQAVLINPRVPGGVGGEVNGSSTEATVSEVTTVVPETSTTGALLEATTSAVPKASTVLPEVSTTAQEVSTAGPTETLIVEYL